MTEVRKAYRVLSVEGCELIGQGANGKVYRTDRETIIKVYKNPDALPEIHREPGAGAWSIISARGTPRSSMPWRKRRRSSA